MDILLSYTCQFPECHIYTINFHELTDFLLYQYKFSQNKTSYLMFQVHVVFMVTMAPKAHPCRGHPHNTGLVLPFSLGRAWNPYLIQVGNPACYTMLQLIFSYFDFASSPYVIIWLLLAFNSHNNISQ